MSNTEVSTCACAPTHDIVVCACGVLTCSNCGAVHQPAHIVDRLSMLVGYYFGAPQNPICRTCRDNPDAPRRRRTRRPERRQRGNEGPSYGPPPSLLPQPRVVNAQVVAADDPLLNRARQVREQQQEEEGEENESTLALVRRLGAFNLARRTGESSRSRNQTNQASPSSTGEGTVQPTTASKSSAQTHERERPYSTGERQPRARQPETGQPSRPTTDRTRSQEETTERERRERALRHMQAERQRHRERERERQQEQFQQRRAVEVRVRQVELMIQARLRRINLGRGGFVGVDQTVPEDVARYMLLQELSQRQRHERERRDGRPQPTTAKTDDKTTTETSRQCTICIETYTDVDDAFPFPPVLRPCSTRHDMDVCVICLCTHIKSQLESRGSAACEDIRCPNLDCDHVYTYKQIKLLADRETFARYDQQCLNINLAKQPNFRRCLRGRCTSGQIYDDIDPDSPFGNRIFCSECGFVMCFKHDCPWHQDLTCDEYDLQRKDDDQETELWLAKKTKSCPNCNIPIQKGKGCFHMTCQLCRFEFCWECLADWRLTRSGRGGHREDCFFSTNAAPAPTAMHGRTIVEAQRNREMENRLGEQLGLRLR